MTRRWGVLVLIFCACGGLRANTLTDMLFDWDPTWPQRFGITGVAYGQTQDYVVGNAEIMLGALPISADAIAQIENEVTQFGVKPDFWVLPFWNVHGILGKVEGTTNVTPAVPGFEAIEVNYDGVVYGVGTTLAYGQDWWWASVTGVITETELDSSTSSVKAWLVTPKIGVKGDRFELWFGATYQNVDERQRGEFNVQGIGNAVYDIELKQAVDWNAQVGFRYAMTDSVFVTVEGGFGDRQSILGHLEFRFW